MVTNYGNWMEAGTFGAVQKEFLAKPTLPGFRAATQPDFGLGTFAQDQLTFGSVGASFGHSSGHAVAVDPLAVMMPRFSAVTQPEFGVGTFAQKQLTMASVETPFGHSSHAVVMAPLAVTVPRFCAVAQPDFSVVNFARNQPTIGSDWTPLGCSSSYPIVRDQLAATLPRINALNQPDFGAGMFARNQLTTGSFGMPFGHSSGNSVAMDPLVVAVPRFSAVSQPEFGVGTFARNQLTMGSVGMPFGHLSSHAVVMDSLAATMPRFNAVIQPAFVVGTFARNQLTMGSVGAQFRHSPSHAVVLDSLAATVPVPGAVIQPELGQGVFTRFGPASTSPVLRPMLSREYVEEEDESDTLGALELVDAEASQLAAALAKFGLSLARPVQGAADAAHSQSIDRWTHFCASARKILDRLLNQLAPRSDPRLLAWVASRPALRNDNGLATPRGRFAYALRDSTDREATFVALRLGRLYNRLAAGIHDNDDVDSTEEWATLHGMLFEFVRVLDQDFH